MEKQKKNRVFAVLLFLLLSIIIMLNIVMCSKMNDIIYKQEILRIRISSLRSDVKDLSNKID